MFNNRNVFDFKAVHSIDGGPHLSMVWQRTWDDSDKGSGVILNNSYDLYKRLHLREELGAFDIHEFSILGDGKTAVTLNYPQHESSLDEFGRNLEITEFLSGGFAEMDVESGMTKYEWDSFPQIPLRESTKYDANSQIEAVPGWDYVHINSVDKNAAGDYLLSMRFTDTIYLVSGIDGHIIWRLGGRTSDFAKDFTFFRQHDAKFIESNETHHVISLLNNASDEFFNEDSVSSAMIIELDTTTNPKSAKLLRRFNRPDGGLTRLRGNTQLLPNKNVVAGWSEGGYFTEFDPEGNVLLEAQFSSKRFNTYRMYKFEYTGRPSYPPDLVAHVWGTDDTNLVTVFYVSWNGATDIASWNFYARASENSSPVLIGNVAKANFETMYIAKGFLDFVTAEAVDGDGNAMGQSDVHRTDTPDWQATGFKGQSKVPGPHDPALIYANNDQAEEENRKAAALDLANAESKEAINLGHQTYNLVHNIGAVFILVIVVCIMCAIAAGIYYCMVRGRRVRSYQHVPSEEGAPEEQVGLKHESED